MKKWYHGVAAVFAAVTVALGLCMDLDQSYSMGGRQKILVYATPIFVLFFDMASQMGRTDDPAQKERIRRRAYCFMFAIYLIAMATILFLGSSFRRAFEERNIWQTEPFTKEHFEMYCNLKPFRSISMYIRACRLHTISARLIVVNLLGNMVAFMPCALFMPVIFYRKQTKWRFFLPTVTAAVVLVELIQFLTMVGQADIDDVILNVFGAGLAFAARPLLGRSGRLREWFL